MGTSVEEKRTEESMLNQLRAGTHAPGHYRAQAPETMMHGMKRLT